jgi:hypothetical protein
VNSAISAALVASTNLNAVMWLQFPSNWPTVSRDTTFVWHEDSREFKGYGVATALIHDRHVLKSILDLSVSEDCQKVEFPKLRFHLYEVKEVRPPRDGGREGGYYITFNATNNKWFNPEEWDQLARSNWDFSRFGIVIVSNAPVPNIRNVIPNL